VHWGKQRLRVTNTPQRGNTDGAPGALLLRRSTRSALARVLLGVSANTVTQKQQALASVSGVLTDAQVQSWRAHLASSSSPIEARSPAECSPRRSCWACPPSLCTGAHRWLAAFKHPLMPVLAGARISSLTLLLRGALQRRRPQRSACRHGARGRVHRPCARPGQLPARRPHPGGPAGTSPALAPAQFHLLSACLYSLKPHLHMPL
jgi:hypothetical protein